MKNLIKQILREETQLPLSFRRRMLLGDAHDDMKKNSLRFYGNGKKPLDVVISLGAKFTADSKVPWMDEEGNEYNDETYRGWVKNVRDYLVDTYGEETKKYLSKVLPNDVFNDDGSNYVLIKHSEPNGGSGFSETYKTWGDLLTGKGWWFPLNWWEVKDKLDNMESGTVRVLKPGDEHNDFGYYFSIRKEPK